MFWQISSFPKCEYHVFLSHSSEDKAGLARPLKDRLSRHGIVSFLDEDDYPFGRDSASALRDELLTSRHAIFFVTESLLQSSRGWCVLEYAYAELIRSNFQLRSGHFANYFLPIFFVPPNDERLNRSVWRRIKELGPFFETGSESDQIEWSTQRIVDFLLKEQQYAARTRSMLRMDAQMRSEIDRIDGRLKRATNFHPSPIRISSDDQ